MKLAWDGETVDDWRIKLREAIPRDIPMFWEIHTSTRKLNPRFSHMAQIRFNIVARSYFVLVRLSLI